MPTYIGSKFERFIAEGLEKRATKMAERAKWLREKAAQKTEPVKENTLVRSPRIEGLEKSTPETAVEPKKESFWGRMLKSLTRIKKGKSNLTPLERAKEIDSDLATRLEKIGRNNEYFSPPVYTDKEILNIVEVNQRNPELAIRLAKRLENESVYNNAVELFDMAKKEPEMFAAVKNYISPEAAQRLELLNNLKHVSAENVKHFPTELVHELERVGAESKKPIDEVFNQPILKEFIGSRGKGARSEAEVKDVTALVKTVAENPVETERFLTKVNEKSVEVLKPVSKKPLGVFIGSEVNELVRLHQEDPKVVESIIDKFGFVKPREIKVLLEYDKRGINVDKYVKEFLEGNPYNPNGTFGSDMDAYIKFRLKAGSVFSNMLKGKSDKEISEFCTKQLGKNKNNVDALERLERYGFKPESEDELHVLIDICNRYPDMKITKDFVNAVLKQRSEYGKELADAFFPLEKYLGGK